MKRKLFVRLALLAFAAPYALTQTAMRIPHCTGPVSGSPVLSAAAQRARRLDSGCSLRNS
jgi:hypothetical protein